MKRTRTFTDDLTDIGLPVLFVLALCFLAVAANPNPAKADESSAHFQSRALVCMVFPNGGGACGEFAHQDGPQALAACFENGQKFDAKLRSHEAFAPAIRNSEIAIPVKWRIACVDPDGVGHVPIEGETIIGGGRKS